jgi:signal peptidase I
MVFFVDKAGGSMTETGVLQSEGRPAQRRKGWVAVALSLALVGLGQMYNGQLRKGVVLFLLAYAAPCLLFLISGRSLRPAFFALLIALCVTIQIAAAIDAWRHARSIGSHFRPARYHRFSVYLFTYLLFGLLLSGALSNYVKDNVVQAFKLPSASMEPTLLIGDHILVDKAASTFARGDLVVFEFPPDAGKAHPRDYIKRIVGLPGEVIEIRNKQLFVNGRQLEEPYSVHREAATLAAASGPRDFFGPVTVPDDSYFVLGDNRDRSYDSRFWGFVQREKLYGRVVSIYWSWNRRQAKVRWERIGAELAASGAMEN